MKSQWGRKERETREGTQLESHILPLFFPSGATTASVTAARNWHHMAPALPLRKLATNFRDIPAGLGTEAPADV